VLGDLGRSFCGGLHRIPLFLSKDVLTN
jgi:hypothetical protein